MQKLIIRKKRSFLRKLVENLFLIIMWSIVLWIIFSVIAFLCHIDQDDLTTMYLLLNISSSDFNRYFEWFAWLVSFILLIGFFVQMHYGMVKEQSNAKDKGNMD